MAQARVDRLSESRLALDGSLRGEVLASTEMMRRALIGLATFASAVVAFVMPATATAAGQPPPGNEPGIAQYTETLPTSGGGQAVGSSSKSHKLPSKIQAKLKREGGRAAASLQVIASSAAYGAPQTKLRTVPLRTRPEPAKPASSKPAKPASPKPAKPASSKPAAVQSQAAGSSGGQAGAGSAASAAATSAGHGYVLAVVLALVLLTAVAAAVAVGRRRRRSA